MCCEAMPLWPSKVLRPCIYRWRSLVAPETCSPAYSRTFDQKPVLALVHNTSVHFWYFSSQLDFIPSTWIFIVDCVFDYCVLFPRSHLVNIVMIILFHTWAMFSRLFGINSHVIGIFSVNISLDLDIWILHWFVLIWESLYLFLCNLLCSIFIKRFYSISFLYDIYWSILILDWSEQ